jgi:hypothetical protein
MFSKREPDSEMLAEMRIQQGIFKETLKQEYMKTQVEIARQQMNNAGMAGAIRNSVANTAFTGTIAGSNASAAQWAQSKPRFDPNKHPATQMALTALVDLWRAKYGDTWVDCMAPVEEGDTFWPAGGARLERNGKLEKYEDGTTWLRIKEDA